jgi:hypothetical protein
MYVCIYAGRQNYLVCFKGIGNIQLKYFKRVLALSRFLSQKSHLLCAGFSTACKFCMLNFLSTPDEMGTSHQCRRKSFLGQEEARGMYSSYLD